MCSNSVMAAAVPCAAAATNCSFRWRRFRQFGGKIVADAGQSCQIVAFLQQRPRILREFAQDARRVAVGTDAERVGAFDLQQIGDFLEHGGDVGIVDWHNVRWQAGFWITGIPCGESRRVVLRLFIVILKQEMKTRGSG